MKLPLPLDYELQMKLSAVKIIRRILIGVICAVALTALVNYLIVTLRQSGDDRERPPMISAEFKRAAEGVEILTRKGSDLRFIVHARLLRETIQNRSFLEGIEASDFDRDGSVRNTIHSDSAVYDQDRKTLDFDGNVHVFLRDGVELRAEAMHYDLDTEIGDIPGKMEFLSNNVTGQANDARFFRNEDRLELDGATDFFLTREKTGAAGETPAEAIRAAAARGTCLLDENRILLSGGVLIESPDMGALSAAAADIKLNNERNKISFMAASGGAVYETRNGDERRTISGGLMVFTAGMTGALEKARISEQAILLVKSAAGEQALRAEEIEMFLDSATGKISEISGTTAASFRNLHGADEMLAEGDVIHAAFVDAGDRLRNVRISGGSRFVMTGKGNAANELRAATITARFSAESDALENLSAEGGVRWKFEPSGEDAARTMLASKLEIRYADAGNYPESGEVSGAVTIEETDAAARMTRRIKAERMRFDFFRDAGQIKSLIAEDGVHAVYEHAAAPVGGLSENGNSGAERYETFSDSLEAFFVPGNGSGALRFAEQRGNFRFVSEGRSASADHGEYDADNRKLTLTGSPEILDAAGRVNGSRMKYDLDGGELTVSGRVRAVFIAGGNLFKAGFRTGGGVSPVVVTSDELWYRMTDERFIFSGGVMALTESQQINAREIAVDGGNMTAAGGVVHRIEETGSGDGAAIIQSEQMEFRRDEGMIRYSGKVEMKSGELTVSTDALNVALDDEAKDIRRVLAEGNALLHHTGRVCRGDVMEWFSAESRFVITGNPATIDDPARGRSTARRLTYYQVEDRISLEP